MGELTATLVKTLRSTSEIRIITYSCETSIYALAFYMHCSMGSLVFDGH